MDTKSKIKIGIVTIYGAENYGAVLQCYALKRYLSKLNVDVSVVDYISKGDRIGYNIFNNNLLHNLQFLRYIIYLLKLPWLIQKKLLRKSKFKQFVETYLHPLSSTKYFYDCLIYGSDQILAYSNRYGGFDNVYWGEGLNSKKKIMYAASMGNIKDGYNDFIESHLKSFDSLAVREKKLSEYLGQFTNKAIEIVVDPTLLLDTADWNELCLKDRIIKDKYILVYNLNNNNIVEKIASQLSTQFKMKIINVYGSSRMHERNESKSTYSPIEFVTLFRDAEYVVTSSFHGTMFSLIFRKQFYVSQLHNIDRVFNVLKYLDLQYRFVQDINDFKIADLYYDNIEEKLNEYRTISVNYLKNNLK